MARGLLIENRGRIIAERIALVLQGSLLIQHAAAVIADAFCVTRLGNEGGRSFGMLPDQAVVLGGHAGTVALLFSDVNEPGKPVALRSPVT